MYNSTPIKGTGRAVSWVCGSLFTIFSVLYLYFMQSDLLATAQHLLSQGKTSYSPLWGTAVITLVLLLPPGMFHRLFHFPARFRALSYFPSCLLLGMLTSGVPGGGWEVRWAIDWWLAGAALLLYLALIWVVLHFPDVKKGGPNFFSYLWPNLGILFLSFAVAGSLAETNDVYHYRLKAERMIAMGQDAEALEVGRKSLDADRSLTAMRVFALDRMGKLGERLFEYPQYSGSEGLVPERSDTAYAHGWVNLLYRHLGGKPGKVKSVTQFLERLSGLPSATSSVADYLLCAYLLDKNLDAFAAALPKYYAIDENLPLHYKEAVVLYDRLRTAPSVLYRDAAVETNLNDFVRHGAQYRHPVERANQCRRMYGHTYWWYYYYQPLE